MALATDKLLKGDRSNTKLIGARLWIFRGIWIIFALVILASEVKSLSIYFKDRLYLCEGFCPPGYLWPEEAQALSAIGLSPEVNAWYFLIIDTLPAALSLIIVGLLLAWLRSDDWLALYTSLFLISLASLKLPFLDTPPWGMIELVFGIFAISSAPILMYLFPSGRSVPRWSGWLIIPVFAWMTYQVLLPDNPWYVLSISMIFILSGIGSLLYRYNHIFEPVEKSQIKWVLWAFSIRPISEVGIRNLLLPLIIPMATTPGLGRVFFHMTIIPIFSTLPFILTAVGMGIAIFRYRLWDIDFVINRSLVYGALTALLIALFSTSLLIINLLFQNFANGQLVALTVSAAVFGVVFHPSRRRLQRFVDQRFYHIEIDYNKTPAPATTGLTNIINQTDLGKYQRLELIGRGGMAEVYKSIHPTLGKPVAIKILPAHLATEPDFQKRFTREAETVSKLQHPNIVRVYDYGEEKGTHYIVMEYLAGKDLGALLKTSGKLTLSQALPIIRQIASALDYAHSQGFVHRDIKPSNIMLDMTMPAEPRAVLTDFGIVKIIDALSAMTGTGGFLGTLDYVAPEQIQGFGNIDSKADIYSFGVMVYEILTGELPFKHNNPGAVLIAHLNQPAPNACDIIPDLPLHIAFAIQRAMEKQPERRHANAAELVWEISGNGK